MDNAAVREAPSAVIGRDGRANPPSDPAIVPEDLVPQARFITQ